MQSFSFPEWNSSLAPRTETLFGQLPAWNVLIGQDPLQSSKTNSETVSRILNELRQLIETEGFETAAEEIIFFKKIKPLFSCALIYWNRLYQLQLHQPPGERRSVRKYWKSELRALAHFFRQHSAFYEYLRTGDDRLDKLYFLRNRQGEENAPLSPDLNPKFTTAADHLVGKILALGLIEKYIGQILEGKQPPGPADNHPLQWTAPKAALVELIYALQSGGVYNHGQSEIKEIAEAFQQFFQVDLGNYYHVFNEIRLRKKNRTSLLDQLREKVLQKMDALDER